MKSFVLGAAALAFTGSLSAASFVLERSIPLPDVKGRIDHFAGDPAGHRLFVAALGNNTVEVLDLDRGKVVHSITGLAEPKGSFSSPKRPGSTSRMATTARCGVSTGQRSSRRQR